MEISVHAETSVKFWILGLKFYTRMSHCPNGAPIWREKKVPAGERYTCRMAPGAISQGEDTETSAARLLEFLSFLPSPSQSQHLSDLSLRFDVSTSS